MHDCTCQYRIILTFHTKSTSKTVFPIASTLHSLKPYIQQNMLKLTKWIELIQRKITFTWCNSRVAVSAIGLQRSLNGIKLTAHLNTFITLPIAEVINLTQNISHVSKKQGQEVSSCSNAWCMSPSLNRWWWKPFLCCSAFLGNRLN